MEKQSKKSEPPGSGGADFRGGVHKFVHKFVILLKNNYLCARFKNFRNGSTISKRLPQQSLGII